MRFPRVSALVLLFALVADSASRAQVGGVVGTAVPGGPSAPQRPGAPPRDRTPNAQPTGTASITGRVVSAEGAPLRRTQVQLAGAGVTGRTAVTDSEGRYVFAGLPAGRYSLRAIRSGYINISYGQRSPTEPTKPIELADGQALSGIDIVVPRGSAITGRVVDEFGEPVVQAQVQALRYQYQPSGERVLQPAPGIAGQTDDLGQFRIYGLQPGEYVVSATSRNQFANTVFSPDGRVVFDGFTGAASDQGPEGYAPTYYPGTPNPAEAQALALGLGQELSVQLQLVPARLAQVSGNVYDSQGRPVTGSMVMLRSAANIAGGANRSSNTGGDGAFNITNVAPGDYFLDVRPRPQPANAPVQVDGKTVRSDAQRGNNADPQEQEFASVPINVGGDVTGLRIVTGKGATISGRVTFEGTPPAAGMRIRVVPQAADPNRSIGLPAARNAQDDGFVGPDGSFELSRVTGPVFLRVTLNNANGSQAPQINYMTKSVIVDGVDVADTPFDPTRRGHVANVTLVLTDKVTDISGVVTDGKGTPLESSTVLIVAEDLPAGVSPQRFQRILQSDRQGKFSVRGMPAGRYVAIAASTIDVSRQYDPALAERVRRRGHGFTVREGEKVTLDLNLATDF